jgi:hypothetical protein
MVQDLALISSRYGHEFDIPYATSCGLDRARNVLGMTSIDVPVTITDAEAHNFYNLATSPAVVNTENVLVVNQLTAPLYPVFSYGIGADSYFSASLKDSITIQGGETRHGSITFTNGLEFTKFMNIHRMMGYDVTGQNVFTGKFYTNWADNASGRFLYTDMNDLDESQVFIVRRESIRRRANCWIKVEQPEGKITVSYTMTELQMVMFSGTERMLPGGAVISEAPALRGDTVPGSVTRDVGIKFLPLVKEEQSDFRYLRLTLSRPVTTLLTSAHQVKAHESTEEHADDTGPPAPAEM